MGALASRRLWVASAAAGGATLALRLLFWRKGKDDRVAPQGREDEVTLSFCKELPKIELHAHLHGSIRDETLLDLMRATGRSDQELQQMRVELKDERTLSQCFKLFDIIHGLVRSLDVVTRITVEVLEDFDAENVRYIELRTTPRDDPDLGITMEGYVDAVLRGFDRARHQKKLRITPKLILSINRARSVALAEKTVDLAYKHFQKPEKTVVGVEFSGNPHKGSFAQFRPVFERARKLGMPVALHCAEVDADGETSEILEFFPERFGHAVVLSEQQVRWMVDHRHRANVEICPTSNMRTLHLTELNQHPTIARWLEGDVPFCVCTDDSGVFATSLSNELHMVAKAFRLSKSQISRLTSRAADMCFTPPEEVRRLLQAN